MGEFERAVAMATLGLNMKRLREVQRLSQIKAAKRADMNGRHWQKLEYGVGNPTMETLIRVALALRTDLLTLFTPPKK